MTTLHLAGLDELILSCRDEKSRALINEAHACYRAGAYRASIISAWVAAVYDLIEKLRELALSGDANAQAEVASLDKAHADDDKIKMQNFENQLLEKCDKTFGFFHPIERKSLDRIFSDRNRAAHPSHIRPGEPFEVNAELARLHIRTVIETVLSQPATSGKSALAKLDTLIGSPSFPSQRDRIRLVLEASPLVNPRASLFNAFILGLVKQAVEDGLGEPERRKRIEIIAASFELHPDLATPLSEGALRKMLSKALEKELKWVVALGSTVPLIAASIEEGLFIRLEEFIDGGTQAEVAGVASDALGIGRLAGKVRSRIGKMNLDEVAKIAGIMSLRMDSSIIDRGLDHLKTVEAMDYYTWPLADTVCSSILQPAATQMTEAQLKRLFQIVDENGQKITRAWGFAPFIESLRTHPLLQAQAFEDEMKKHEWGAAFIQVPQAQAPNPPPA